MSLAQRPRVDPDSIFATMDEQSPTGPTIEELDLPEYSVSHIVSISRMEVRFMIPGGRSRLESA